MNEFPVIETERLVLREVTSKDAPDMLVYLSDPDVVKHMGLEPFQSIDDALDEIKWYKSIYEEDTGVRWVLSLKSTEKVIGSCGFLNRHPKHKRAEIGFELSKDFWGKGYASEALEAVVAYGYHELELERIEALIEPDNLPSQKLVEKHGFMKEGVLRHYEYTCGKFDDLAMYSMLRGEYFKC
ncbi:GNAT family N-acetyltransferase [Guptibacillus algicola]|uniref:GNAT family N-acetyltransferase n=1 Tax=Guptibacillus algicola TaxID=225844 RepID=UPI001CD27C4C|nr:GNAT family protein [Alkalihalobacillus algicola]MCA0987159.1 GNAT family N-acetyltransferase [Alkalihalobacillus algicola]